MRYSNKDAEVTLLFRINEMMLCLESLSPRDSGKQQPLCCADGQTSALERLKTQVRALVSPPAVNVALLPFTPTTCQPPAGS